MAQILWNVDRRTGRSGTPRSSPSGFSDVPTKDRLCFHDTHDTPRAAYAGIIDGLEKQGFTLVTVPDLLDDLEPGQVYYSR
jgi:peptidoglycan/xylan/chitin deacetylase (PgdA/CDA1 family)